MATLALTPRQPFSELSGQRLRQLTSTKNVQNSMPATPIGKMKSPLSQMLKPSPSPVATTVTKKRGFEPTLIYDDKSDGENVDPVTFSSPTKKSKISTFTFPRSALISTAGTPLKSSVIPRVTPSTAPAGRSPPRKARLMLEPKRRMSTPYKRIEPPVTATSTNDEYFFSLSEALAGTRARASLDSSRSSSAASMPASWFFDIHEDTPEQEAENLMEHSTHVLDLSSDDEASLRIKDDRGKENIAPEGSVHSAPHRAKKVQRRRKVVKSDTTDDGERSPLSEVEREDFFPAGVTASDVIVVPAEEEKPQEKKDAWANIVIFEDA